MACLLAKAAFIDKECAEIEALEHSSSKEYHERIREITGKFSGRSSAANVIKDRDGHIQFDKEDVLRRWKEYSQDLNSDPSRKVTIEFSGEVTGEPIMVDEVERALKKVPNGKASGYDIVQDLGVATMCKLFNEWYDSGTVRKRSWTHFCSNPKESQSL